LLPSIEHPPPAGEVVHHPATRRLCGRYLGVIGCLAKRIMETRTTGMHETSIECHCNVSSDKEANKGRAEFEGGCNAV